MSVRVGTCMCMRRAQTVRTWATSRTYALNLRDSRTVINFSIFFGGVRLFSKMPVRPATAAKASVSVSHAYAYIAPFRGSMCLVYCTNSSRVAVLKAIWSSRMALSNRSNRLPARCPGRETPARCMRVWYHCRRACVAGLSFLDEEESGGEREGEESIERVRGTEGIRNGFTPSTPTAPRDFSFFSNHPGVIVLKKTDPSSSLGLNRHWPESMNLPSSNSAPIYPDRASSRSTMPTE